MLSIHSQLLFLHEVKISRIQHAVVNHLKSVTASSKHETDNMQIEVGEAAGQSARAFTLVSGLSLSFFYRQTQTDKQTNKNRNEHRRLLISLKSSQGRMEEHRTD
jgi:hypothetical protein